MQGISGVMGLLVSSLCAQPHFETTRIEILATPDQDEVTAEFVFENRGSTDAKIVSVTSGCQCLSAKADAAAVAPQEKGRITGVFKVPGNPGVSEKTIRAHIVESGRAWNIVLTVVVELRELITIEPRTVAWIGGQTQTERTFTVTMNDAEPIRLLGVESSRPGFDIRTETVKEGVEYRVHITPQAATGPTLGVFRFKTDCKHPRFATPIAFAHVKKP